MNCARAFAENLRSHRKRKGLSQEQLGFRAGLHRTEISLLERGARVPRIDTLIKLVTVLDIEVDDLRAGIVREPGETQAGRFTS